MATPATVAALTAQALSPEGLSGAAYDSRADLVWRGMLSSGLNEAIQIAREDLLLSGTHASSASPLAVSGKRVLYARRNGTLGWRNCSAVLGPAPTGLHAPTAHCPVVTIFGGTATIVPAPATGADGVVAAVGPVALTSGQDETTPGLHPLVTAAGLARARADLIARAHEAAAVVEQTITAANAPASPNPTAPVDPGATAMPADMVAGEPWVEETAQDPEMVAAAVAAKRATIEHFAALVQEAQGRYRTSAEVYSAVWGGFQAAVASFRTQVETEQGDFARVRQGLQVALEAARADADRAMALIAPAPPPEVRPA